MITKLNNFINKKILLIFTIFLFMQPVLDIITGIMIYSKSSIYSISAIIRIIFLIFMMYYITFIKKTKFFKLFLIILLYSVIFCLVNYIFKDNGNLVIEIKNLLNNIYLPITMIFIFEIFNNNKFDIKKIYMILLIYLLLVFIPNILGIGFDSYAYSKEGSVGFFYSANAIGSIISMLCPIFICELIKQKNKIYLILFLIVYTYVLLTLGTKAPLLCASILLLYYFIVVITKLIKSKSYKKLIVLVISCLMLLVLGLKLITLTPFYDNLIIHLNFLNIKKISDLFTFHNIDHFIFSSRLSFFKDSFEVYLNSNFMQKLFGIGYFIDNKVMKLVEMDYLDTLLHQGIIGFIVIFFIYFKTIFDIFKMYFKKFKSNFLNIKETSMIISIIISILCAFLTGHVLATPAVSIFVAILLIIYYNYIYGKGDNDEEV